jgi:hypothetical protein
VTLKKKIVEVKVYDLKKIVEVKYAAWSAQKDRTRPRRGRNRMKQAIPRQMQKQAEPN